MTAPAHPNSNHMTATALYDHIGSQAGIALQSGTVRNDFIDTTIVKFAPGVVADELRQMIVEGNGFIATTGGITAGSTNTFGACVFHDNTVNKNMIIYSVRYSNSGANMASLYIPASNPALGNNLTVNNAQAGGGSSAIAQAAATYATANKTPAGTLLDSAMVAANGVVELLPSVLIVPASVAGGIAVYAPIANAATWSMTIRWVEY